MSYEVVRQATVDRMSVTAHYDSYIRFFSLHQVGTNRDGLKVVLGLQYAGGKRGGLRPSGEWVCFEVNALVEVKLNSDIWKSGDRLPRPRCVQTIDVSVGDN